MLRLGRSGQEELETRPVVPLDWPGGRPLLRLVLPGWSTLYPLAPTLPAVGPVTSGPATNPGIMPSQTAAPPVARRATAIRRDGFKLASRGE